MLVRNDIMGVLSVEHTAGSYGRQQRVQNVIVAASTENHEDEHAGYS